MTTIAFDGKTLAADRAQFQGAVYIGETVKIARRADGAMVGGAGDASFCGAFCRWFMGGEQGERPSLGDRNDCAEMLVIRPDGGIERYTYSGWFEHTGAPVALGAGREFALGAMDAGADAETAVRLATRRVGGNCERIDALHLEPAPVARLVAQP